MNENTSTTHFTSVEAAAYELAKIVMEWDLLTVIGDEMLLPGDAGVQALTDYHIAQNAMRDILAMREQA
jgi:hypothetical protein